MVTLLLALVAVNDANWVSFGGAGAFAPHKTIHMLGEDISITIYDDKIHVRVFFSFENKGPATNVEMAFPFEDTANAQGESFLRFATKVDGVAAAVRKVALPPVTREGKDWKKESYDIARAFAYVKSVEFGENQKRTVLVDYVTNHGYAGTGWRMNEYILHTGATWAGKIGQCTISVDWSATKQISKPALQFYKLDGKEVEQEWTMLTARKAMVTLANFEPDFDLSLTSMDSFWNVRLNGKDLPQYRGHSGGSGPVLTGEGRDPLIYDFGLFYFFDEGDGRDFDYCEGAVANAFGNFVDVSGKKTLRDGLGRVHTLRREVVSDEPYPSKVRLKDVVEALGGTFKWVEEEERIDLTLPTRDKPIRKKGEPIPPLRL